MFLVFFFVDCDRETSSLKSVVGSFSFLYLHRFVVRFPLSFHQALPFFFFCHNVTSLDYRFFFIYITG